MEVLVQHLQKGQKVHSSIFIFFSGFERLQVEGQSLLSDGYRRRLSELSRRSEGLLRLHRQQQPRRQRQDLQGQDLRGQDLRGQDLRGQDFQGQQYERQEGKREQQQK